MKIVLLQVFPSSVVFVAIHGQTSFRLNVAVAIFTSSSLCSLFSIATRMSESSSTGVSQNCCGPKPSHPDLARPSKTTPASRLASCLEDKTQGSMEAPMGTARAHLLFHGFSWLVLEAACEVRVASNSEWHSGFLVLPDRTVSCTTPLSEWQILHHRL